MGFRKFLGGFPDWDPDLDPVRESLCDECCLQAYLPCTCRGDLDVERARQVPSGGNFHIIAVDGNRLSPLAVKCRILAEYQLSADRGIGHRGHCHGDGIAVACIEIGRLRD